MDKTKHTPTPQDDEKIKTLINLKVGDPEKADIVAKALGFDSRSAYLRYRINRDYRNVMRKQETQVTA